MINPFFKNTGPYEINDLLKLISIKDQSFSDEKINDIKDLSSSKKGDMTPFYIQKSMVNLLNIQTHLFV